MEAHRTNATCAACHVRMDPLGFGLENFDAIGAWRTDDGKFPIDATGALPDGRTFNGPGGAGGGPARGPRRVRARALTEKLLTYALGRGLERYDRPHGQGHRAARRRGRLPLLGPGAGDRAEPSVPDAERRRRTVMTPDLPAGTSRAARSCAARGPPWPCRCWTPCVRPSPRAASAGRAPVRLSFVYVPNGIIMPDWKPAEDGQRATRSRAS